MQADDFLKYRTLFDQQYLAVYGPLAASPYGPAVDPDETIYYPTPVVPEKIIQEGFGYGFKDFNSLRTDYDRNYISVYGPLAGAPYGQAVSIDASLYYPTKVVPSQVQENFRRNRWKNSKEKFSWCNNCTGINLNRK